jgi:hypothetical protein
MNVAYLFSFRKPRKMSKLINCKTCESEMATDAKSCPKCGAKNTQKKGCMYALKLCVLSFLGLIVLGSIFRSIGGNSEKMSSEPSVSSKSSSAGTSVQLPEDQIRFINLVKEGQSASRSAANDMARGGALAKRNNELGRLNLEVSNWVGKVTKVDSNSDGLGVLEIEIADDVSVQTWNNALSDIGEKTLIQPGTPLFETAAGLKPGQYIKFSGRFFRDDESGLGEQSLGLRGKLESPEFTFKFSSIAKL